MNFCVTPFLEGCGSGAGLIIAIGAQNAFLLKQGLLKNYVFLTAFICALNDSLLITIGVGGLGKFIACNVMLMQVAKWGGALFLIWYGWRAFQAAYHARGMKVHLDEKPDLIKSLTTVLVVSFLNPHAYLDALVLLGSISAQFPDTERWCFGGGAILASFIWFFTVGYGARFLAPLFQRARAWQILDIIIGVIMWGLAIKLVWPSI